MSMRSRDYYRSRAIQRRRDPNLDARLAASSAAFRTRFNAMLDESPLIRQLNAATAARHLVIDGFRETANDE